MTKLSVTVSVVGYMTVSPSYRLFKLAKRIIAAQMDKAMNAIIAPQSISVFFFGRLCIIAFVMRATMMRIPENISIFNIS